MRPVSGLPSQSHIFGSAKTGATIIDSLDTLWIMGLKKEFKQGRNWVRYRFDLKKANQMISSFETVIRFLGGLLSAYHMSGDKVFLDKAKDVAVALEFAFRVGSFISSL